MTIQTVDAGYELARQRYADIGVDTDAALRRLTSVSISLHCWQGDDVGGFEDPDGNAFGLEGFDEVRRSLELRRQEHAERVEAERRVRMLGAQLRSSCAQRITWSQLNN